MGTGERIRRCRTAAGLTQKQLAEAVGLTESAIRNYELGIRRPKQVQIESIAEALGVSPEALEDLGVESARQAMEVLFRQEDEMGLVPIDTADGVGIGIEDPSAKGAQKAQAALKAWKRMRDDLDAGKISKTEYEAWKASFGSDR